MFKLICFALKEEAAPFRKIAAGKAATAQAGISILLTGIGRQNAEKSVREFLAGNSGGASVPASRLQNASTGQARLARTLAPPDLVLTCGFAGGLNPDLKLGEVVFETSFPNSSRGNEAQTGIGEKLEPAHIGCYELEEKLLAAGAKPAKIFYADRIATTVAEKKKLRAETGADAVEMESAAIHAVCREHGIPCATVRVISDTASEDLPLDFNTLAKPDKSLDFGKLFLTIAKSPGKIGALMELQKKTSFAAKRLANVLIEILYPPR
jgi:adenosylhomocysteine nucleosidase